MSSFLFGVFDDFGIRDKVAAVATDNASVEVCMVEKHLKVPHIRCFAHSLNLVVKNSLIDEASPTETKSLIAKVKRVVKFFHRSTNAADRLRMAQTAAGCKERKLINDVDTRWNSTLEMLRRYSEEHNAVYGALTAIGKKDLLITDDELKVIQSMVETLAPFEDATKEMSAEKSSSLSKAIPTIRGIANMLSHAPPSPLRDTLKRKMSERFPEIENNPLATVATFLDPRFKALHFSESCATRTKTLIIELMEKEEPADREEEDNEEAHVQDEATPAKKPSLWDFHDQSVVLMKKAAKTQHVKGPQLELQRFLEIELLRRTNNPLVWWESNAPHFPRLAKIARRYLAMPSSSTPSERLFSKAGQLVSARRSCLKPSKIDMILFLNKHQ